MSEKMGFVYSHGGPVLDDKQPDGLNERGRNIVKSIRSAVASGADRVFVSESVTERNSSQFEILLRKGLFSGVEGAIDFQHYPIEKNVKFPKNYLMNRGVQRANGFFGMIFSDSDVLFQPGFPQRAANELKRYEFSQPEYIMYLDPNGNDMSHLETTMKRAVVVEGMYKNNLSYIEGMPGMVNIARRESFLFIGGFSQAISGVNFEDIEYQIRLKILGKKTSFMHDEWCRHIWHSRSSIARQSENLPNMFFENANFMNWWIDYCLQIQGNSYNTGNFSTYMKTIMEALRENEKNHNTYKNETGIITHGFDSSVRYRGFAFGSAEPYVESGTKEEKITAVINAANFWRLSAEEIMQINPPWKFAGVSLHDVISYQKAHTTGEKGKKTVEMLEDIIRRRAATGKTRKGSSVREIEDIIGRKRTEKKSDTVITLERILKKRIETTP